MQIKNKLFPYPIIFPNAGSYKTAKLTTSIKDTIDGMRLKLEMTAKINNKEVNKLIDLGKAKYAFHLECKYTYFRKFVLLNINPCVEYIMSRDIDCKLEICPIIVAEDTINNFSTHDLDDIYAGENVTFKKGDIIAVGEQLTLDIIKEQDELKKLSSIFYVQKYSPDNEKNYNNKVIINTDGDRQIGILMPANDASRFNQIKDERSRKNTLFSALYFPALIEVVNIMKDDVSDAEGGGHHQEKKWYAVLKNLGEKKGLGSVEDWVTIPSFEIAQILFEYPIQRYLKEITSPDDEDE